MRDYKKRRQEQSDTGNDDGRWETEKFLSLRRKQSAHSVARRLSDRNRKTERERMFFL